MRAGSKRLPRKNIKAFHGRPIFHYTVEYARATGLFDEIMVSTESDEVCGLCEEINLAPPFRRPKELSTDDAQLVDVVVHVLDEYESLGKRFDNVCMLWATAPMRTDSDITAAYHMLNESTDAVVGVTKFDLPVFGAQKIAKDGTLTPLFPDMLRRPGSTYPSVVCVNGSMCWVKVDAFRRHATWLPPRLKGYTMSRHFSPDIDSQEDWEIAEYHYDKYFSYKRPQ